MEVFDTLVGPWDSIMYILAGLFIALWIYTILRVTKDISWRTDNFVFQLFCILLVLFGTPFIGLPIYFLIRPMQHDIADDEDARFVVCYTCHRPNDPEFAFCVFCGESLKVACTHCGKPVGNDYMYCAWCGEGTKEDEKIEEA